jgi:hypothetical protein
MQYQVVLSRDPEELEELVSELLAAGYACSGSLAMLYLPNAEPGEQIIYAQAVVKGEE